LPLLDGSESPSERFSVGALYAGRGEDARVRYYVREGGYKLIWSFDRRADLSDQPALEELYDLRTDPGELHNLSATAPPVLEHLRQRMHAWMQQHSASAPGPGEGVREQLRQLGYV
jgi:arylsulfatase A-like enzyme